MNSGDGDDQVACLTCDYRIGDGFRKVIYSIDRKSWVCGPCRDSTTRILTIAGNATTLVLAAAALSLVSELARLAAQGA